MNHDILKNVIYDQHRTIRSFNIVRRPRYTFDLNADYIVVGLRRAGKSTLLYSLARDLIESGKDWNQIIYINFEDERLAGFTASDFNGIVSLQKEMSDREGWFFLDEVQNIEGWEKFARRLADAGEHVFITGSSSRMLSSEMEQRLGGRYLTKYVTPYNFTEYLDAMNVKRDDAALFSTKGQGEIRRAFNEFFIYGGLPETLILKDRREYLSSVYSKILLGDIVCRNSIRNVNALRIMIKKMAESVKDELSYSKMYNILKTIGIKLSKDSVIDYISFTLQSYLIFRVDNYFSSFGDRETRPKYYFADNGLLNLFLISREPVLLENYTAVILQRKYGSGFYYLKTDALDVDFFVPDTGEVIQVAYSIENISSERETGSLLKAAKTVKEARSFRIITYEEEKELYRDGVSIRVTPIWKYALES